MGNIVVNYSECRNSQTVILGSWKGPWNLLRYSIRQGLAFAKASGQCCITYTVSVSILLLEVCNRMSPASLFTILRLKV